MSDNLPAIHPPEMGIRYWVERENGWCMAVVDKKGKWLSFSNGREISDVINFFDLR